MRNDIQLAANIILALATAVLAVATVALFRATRSLSKFTELLLRVETQRDERDHRVVRRRDLVSALDAAEQVQRIRPDDFASRLNTPESLPLSEVTAIERLQSLSQYIDDPDCKLHLEFLCTCFDSIRREKERLRVDAGEVAKRVRVLQDRMQWFVDKARVELRS